MTGSAAGPLVSTAHKCDPEGFEEAWISPDGEVLDPSWWLSARCPNPRRGVAFRLASGLLVPVPCGQIRCEHCSRFHGLVALEMVRSTSERMGNPEVAVTLTSVDPDRDVSRMWSRDTEQVLRALRRRWPLTEYLAFMEWTTGQGTRSGGRRRPHSHLLVRGVPREAAAVAEELVRDVWASRTGANRVEVAPLRAAENGVAYLALHHLKGGQAPPEGWTGRRLRASVPCPERGRPGWWGADPGALRRQARREVAERAHRAAEVTKRKEAVRDLVEQGVPDDVAEGPCFRGGRGADPSPPSSTGRTGQA